MSEYWKSVPRKFCDFCKCWITDNKPSVEFHERGKRHQENVELRLKEVRKKSLQNSMQEAEMKAQMDKMEQAALEAFKKDLKDNPELAAKYGVSLEPKPQTKNDDTSSGADNITKGDNVKEWYEAVTPEGYHYYWSTVTGESKWDPPDDFFSLQDQEASQTKEDSNSGTTNQDSNKPDKSTAPEDHAPSIQVTRSDPRNSRSAYGTWDVIKETEQPVVYNETSAPPDLDDIPLPTDSTGEETKSKPQKTKFAEKTVISLGSSGGAATFKKRKIAPGARNTRQKDNND